MKKKTMCFLLDITSFVLFITLLLTGLLMHFILPPGYGHFRQLLGMNRHMWGDLHFWIALTFLIIIFFHLYLHWKWIVCMFREKLGIKSRM